MAHDQAQPSGSLAPGRWDQAQAILNRGFDQGWQDDKAAASANPALYTFEAGTFESGDQFRGRVFLQMKSRRAVMAGLDRTRQVIE
jgi:hypothetical protein